MFGTKIRSWMEAQIARSRAKRRERKGTGATQAAQQEYEARAFEPKLFGTRPDFNEVLPALPISSSSFKPQRTAQNVHQHHQQQHQHHHHQQQQQQQQQHHHQQHQQALKTGQQQYAAAGSAVNLSSPESAYSTGYSTDGTSPCATYAPEHYANVRDSATGKRCSELQREVGRAPTNRTTQTGDKIDTTGTYSVSRGRLPEPTEYEQHPWRKPTPPTTSRPLASSPSIQAGQLVRKPYSSPAVDVLQHHLSPRRTTLLTATTTQEMPIKSPRQRSRVKTNPWQDTRGGSAMMTPSVARPWSRQQQHHDAGRFDHYYRQESLSVGRTSVSRTDWRNAAQLRQQQRQQQLRNRTRSNSGSSYSSSRSRSYSRSCSISSSSSSSNASNSRVNISSRGSDDATLNDVMGQYEENYPYDKETDIVSDHSDGGGCGDNSSSANFSSDMSASSLDMQYDTRSRSATRYQTQSRGLSGRKQRRRKQRRSVEPKEDEEVELLQEVLRRRLKNHSSEASAQSNRALLERLLMKNAHSGFEGRRAWSATPAPMRPVASRSVGGTPICLRRRISRPRNKLIFERNHQVYPAQTMHRKVTDYEQHLSYETWVFPLQESSNSLKNTSVSELALIEADREADLKYAQLIMEAERMLLSARQQLELEEPAEEISSPRLPRGFCRKQKTAPNRRVELIKNAELNAELVFSKSRNSQLELSSGSIKDLLDHSSPKRLLQQQQKKMIAPVLSQTIVTKWTEENNLSTFQSIDVKPTATLLNTAQSNDSSLASGYSCPQSEPVKRKVYEGQDGGRLLQYQAAPWLRSSDGDCASDQQQSQLQSMSAKSSYSQLRKHMLIETLQGLKQSLEDQSAALKMNCLRPL